LSDMFMATDYAPPIVVIYLCLMPSLYPIRIEFANFGTVGRGLSFGGREIRSHHSGGRGLKDTGAVLMKDEG
jgi:hypothetical protein